MRPRAWTKTRQRGQNFAIAQGTQGTTRAAESGTARARATVMATRRLVGGAVGLALAIAAAIGISGRIAYRFHARDLHVVMGPVRAGSPVRFRVRIDGHAPGDAHGIDVDEQGNGAIIEPRLHQLIRQPEPIGDREFTIEFLDPGAEVFSFTFG